jgi:hypothetical protein
MVCTKPIVPINAVNMTGIMFLLRLAQLPANLFFLHEDVVVSEVP